MRFIVLLFFVAVAIPAAAATNQTLNPSITNLEFQDIYFGAFPSDEMICIKGPCPSGKLGEGITPQERLFSTYMQPTDITHLNNVRISPPNYDFFQDQFLRASFDIICETKMSDYCQDAVIKALDQTYNLTELINKVRQNHVQEIDSYKLYQTESGALVEIIKHESTENSTLPRVRIYDNNLMNIARKTANPEFIPVQIASKH